MFNRENLNFIKKWYLAVDGRLLTIFYVLVLSSCMFSFSFSPSVANRIGVNEYHFFKHQLVFSVISLFLVFVISLMNKNLAKKSVFVFFFIALLLLILVPFFGFRTKGAKRWIYILGFSFQPAEFIKPALILLNSIFFEKIIKTKDKKYLVFSLIFYFICVLFIIKQPDIGTLILLSAVFFTQIFLLDIIEIKYYLYLLVISIISVFLLYKSLPHVSNRVDNFLTSLKNPEMANYQVKRSLLSYKNSGLLGNGFLNGYIKNHIPDVHTDFIFPAITEEFGFIVSLLMVSLYLYIFIRVIILACFCKDLFQFAALFGLSLLLIVQTTVNICVSMNLLPTKGMTLPLLSYGGSSIISMSILFGYILTFTKNDFGIGEQNGGLLIV